MTSFTIIANTAQFAAQITQLEQRVTSLQPFYEDTGRALKKQIDSFFKTGIGADSQPWQANAFSTVQGYLKENKGYKKDGSLTVRGLKMASSKKVLQGITGRLRREMYYNSTNRGLTIGSPMPYAVSTPSVANSKHGVKPP